MNARPAGWWRRRPSKRRKADTMSSTIRLAVISFFAVVLPAASSLAQAPGYVRVKFVKAGVMVGAGGGSGVLTYRGRDYPFRVSGLSLGVTAGASVSRLEGWASGIRQVSDFAGTYSAVGAGAQDEFVLAAIAQNLKRLATLVARPPPAQALSTA